MMVMMTIMEVAAGEEEEGSSLPRVLLDVFDQISNRDGLQAVLPRKLQQLRRAGHTAVGSVHNFAQRT